MKITIELEIGEETGAVVGILNWGLNEAKEALAIIPNTSHSQHSQVGRAIQYATQVKNQIEFQMNAAIERQKELNEQ